MTKSKESVAAILFDPTKEKILLIKRRDIPVWVMPGGGIDCGESPENATIREIFEETGYEAKIVRQVAKYLPTNKLTTTTYFYECAIHSGSPSITVESSSIAFFPLTSLFFHMHFKLFENRAVKCSGQTFI